MPHLLVRAVSDGTVFHLYTTCAPEPEPRALMSEPELRAPMTDEQRTMNDGRPLLATMGAGQGLGPVSYFFASKCRWQMAGSAPASGFGKRGVSVFRIGRA